MAVVVRERRQLGGVWTDRVPVYKSDRMVTADAQRRADALDLVLARKAREIEGYLRAKGLLELKGRPGVLRLWYELGKRLSFVDSLPVDPPEDRKYVWRALYDHMPDLVPGPGRGRADRGDSHFKYCYLVSRLDWNSVAKAGDWTSWVEFLDSARIRDDERVLEWLSKRTTDATPDWIEFTASSRQSWVRPLAKALRQQLRGRDTSVLSTDELETELDSVFRDVSSRLR